MDFLVNGIQAVANFLWGTPMTIALLGIGIYMTIKFKFKYQFSLKFMFQNSIGKLFKKGEKGEGIRIQAKAQTPIPPLSGRQSRKGDGGKRARTV